MNEINTKTMQSYEIKRRNWHESGKKGEHAWNYLQNFTLVTNNCR